MHITALEILLLSMLGETANILVSSETVPPKFVLLHSKSKRGNLWMLEITLKLLSHFTDNRINEDT